MSKDNADCMALQVGLILWFVCLYKRWNILNIATFLYMLPVSASSTNILYSKSILDFLILFSIGTQEQTPIPLPSTNSVYSVKSVCYCDDNQQADLNLV